MILTVFFFLLLKNYSTQTLSETALLPFSYHDINHLLMGVNSHN